MVKTFMDDAEMCRDEPVYTHQCELIELKPYPYQVGGHNCILVYDDETICKPLIDQEQLVYAHFPNELKAFIPRCRGVVNVHFEMFDGDILAYAFPDGCPCIQSKNYCMAKKTIHNNKFKFVKSDCDDWTTSVTENGITRQWESAKLKKIEKFILLENVTFSLKRPCVLDLKMGTRCFGDGSTQAKYERKKKRALESTSAALGVRLCGMMVYQCDTGVYSFTDKYQGRRFSNEDFFYAIKRFFFNGIRYRTELLSSLITKLLILLEQIEKIECCRFYCSSLLILYDGHEDEGYQIVPRIDVKMIDFAQTRVKDEPTNYHVGTDRGYILGIKTLIKIADEIKASI
ncbi:inositol hexakisphosphate kinase 1 [Hydra vulgaris]|uniref:inositol hexakisphosphate kinase 1 n=1 Tax=Hydra vulgaris TaxID=6087 RepID=UPI00064140A1|nr:inositol hexakisphosphate kinase 1 [Hydra vulgaris]